MIPSVPPSESEPRPPPPALTDPRDDAQAAPPAAPRPDPQHDARRLQLALWASGEHIWQWDAQTDRLQVDRFEALTAAAPGPLPPPDQALALTDRLSPAELAERVHPDDRAALRSAWAAHRDGRQPVLDLRFRLQVGLLWRWLRVRGRALARDAQGHALRAIGTLGDVTVQQRAEASLRLMAHAFAGSRDAMVVVDAQGQIQERNTAFARLTGGTAPPLGAALTHWLVPAPAAEPAVAALPQLLPGQLTATLAQVRAEGAWRGLAWLRGSDELRVPVELSVSAVPPGDGREPAFLLVLQDLRERRQAQAQLERLALTDALTGLGNRVGLQRQIVQRLAQAQPFALLMIELAGFHELNHSHGPERADQLLVAVAQRLQALRPAEAALGRWGAGSFVLLLAAGSGDTELRAAAQGMLAALAEPFELGGDALVLRAALGAVQAPEHGRDFAELMRRLDLATQASRAEGGPALAFFDASHDQPAQRRVRLASALRSDADRNALQFAAQPKVDAAGCVVGLELLMRWSPEAFGPVSPAEFIPLAEQVGLIQRLGRLAAHAAAQLAADGVAAGHAVPVAVNLSPLQLLQPGLDAMLLNACRRHGIAPALLELELTESALVHNLSQVAPLLKRLRAQGFALSLDDFGTGYSSLSYLRHLPFDKVKIDRSFVLDIPGDATATRMLQSIVQLCEALGMQTVAEGVETAAQVQALTGLGVHEFQGWHFARAVPTEAWLAWMRAQPAAGALRLQPGALK